MSKPKNMTPEQEAALKLRDNERQRKWCAANREKNREKCRKWFAANPEKNRENCRKWAAANPEKTREKSRKWAAANPEKNREKRLKSYRKTKQQAAADQFFILTGAVKQISNILTKKQNQ